MPDDDLLSRTSVHYHRRKSVSRSCSGWEGVGPLRYGRQAVRGWSTRPVRDVPTESERNTYQLPAGPGAPMRRGARLGRCVHIVSRTLARGTTTLGSVLMCVLVSVRGVTIKGTTSTTT